MSHIRWLAKYTGITEWEIDWEAKYAVHTPGTTAEARSRQCGRAQLTGSLWHSYMHGQSLGPSGPCTLHYLGFDTLL